MSRNHNKINYGYYAALITGVAALAILVGVYTVRRNLSQGEQYVDLNSDDKSFASESGEQDATSVGADVDKAGNSDLSKAATAGGDGQVADADSTDTDSIGKADLAMADETKETMLGGNVSGDAAGSEKSEAESTTSEESSEETTATSATVFSKKSTLTWPVQGNVILPYSMDTTVYYKTLDAYKCNPGMLIESKSGTAVYSSYAGTVASITENSEYGKMVTVDLGDGYQVTYGQLKDVCVSEGETIEQGTAIATIAKPTDMFSKEGANLYFALQKDGEYINPEAYLQ